LLKLKEILSKLPVKIFDIEIKIYEKNKFLDTEKRGILNIKIE